MPTAIEDDKKKQQPIGKPIYGPPEPSPASVAANTPIGSPIMTAKDVAPTVPAPELPAGPAPAPPTGEVTQPPIPSPAGLTLQGLTAQGPPQLHGIKRVLDTIAGATNIGSAIERAGGFGTQGYEAKLEQAGGAAKLENEDIEAGQKAQKTASDIETERTGSELVDPNDPNMQIMRKNAAPIATADIASKSRQSIAETAQSGATQRNAATIAGADARNTATIAGANERAAGANQARIHAADIAAANRVEPGSYIPVPDAQGNTVGYVNPKSRKFVAAEDIDNGAATEAAGGHSEAGAPVIPPRPSPVVVASQKAAGDALNYAHLYENSGQYTGPGDEMLMEKFFELAKPSTGFRMSQPQIDMLMHARSWMSSAEGFAFHATNGRWFPDVQRKQIIAAMEMGAQAKGVGPGGGGGTGAQPAPPTGGFAAWKAGQK